MKIGNRGVDEPEINLIPLIDVLFCLILFLVLTTSFNQRAATHLIKRLIRRRWLGWGVGHRASDCHHL